MAKKQSMESMDNSGIMATSKQSKSKSKKWYYDHLFFVVIFKWI